MNKPARIALSVVLGPIITCTLCGLIIYGIGLITIAVDWCSHHPEIAASIAIVLVVAVFSAAMSKLLYDCFLKPLPESHPEGMGG